MQAVILAAGRGTRMGALTESVPKPMLEVVGKTLLEHKFELLRGFDEIILIVGYQGDAIRGAVGAAYQGIPLRYIEQEELNGTMGALALACPYLKERFLVMMGDDIYAKEDIAALRAAHDWVMVVQTCEHMAAGGKVIADEAGTVVAIEEGDYTGTAGLMNTNLLALSPEVFDYPMIPKSAGSSEYGLPQTVLAASRASGIPLLAVETAGWIQITSPEDLERAERMIEGNK